MSIPNLDIDMKPIIERLIQARHNAGLSQMQVARMLGLATASSFTSIEQGSGALTLERFLKLCVIYDIDSTWALTGVNPHFDPQRMLEQVKRTKMAIGELDDLLELLASLRQG